MTTKHKTYFNWSTGKDSALALFHLLQDEKYQVDHLLTSVNSHYDRVSMHGLRRELMEIQTREIGIPFSTIELPEQPDMDTYERLMSDMVFSLKLQGFDTAAFGDIFLEDLKKYRELNLKKFEIGTVFPIWKRDTTELIHEFLDLGFKTIIISINSDKLDKSFAGRIIDKDFLKDLPQGVDPCGENGEFHTFCYDGPIFNNPVDFTIGENVYKEYDAPKGSAKDKIGYWFTDLLLKSNS